MWLFTIGRSSTLVTLITLTALTPSPPNSLVLIFSPKILGALRSWACYCSTVVMSGGGMRVFIERSWGIKMQPMCCSFAFPDAQLAGWRNDEEWCGDAVGGLSGGRPEMMTDDPGKMATDQTGLAQKTPRSEDGDPRWGSSTKAKQTNHFVTDCITSTSRRPDLIMFKEQR